MKVAKEEIIGLVRALELFVDADHESEWADWRAKSTTVSEAAGALDGVKAWVHEGPMYEGPTAPTATIELAESWDGPKGNGRTERHCGPASRRSTSGSCPTNVGCGLRPSHSRGTRQR